MPVRKRIQLKANKQSRLTAEVRMVLETGSDMLGLFRDLTPAELESKLRELWGLHGAEVLRDFIAENPGRRPECWWKFSAPQPRPAAARSGGNFQTWAERQAQLRIEEIAVLVRHKLLTRGEEAALKERAVAR